MPRDRADRSSRAPGGSAHTQGGRRTPFVTRLPMVIALAIVLAIALFVIRSRWLGLVVLLGGYALVFLLFRFALRWPLVRILRFREPD